MLTHFQDVRLLFHENGQLTLLGLLLTFAIIFVLALIIVNILQALVEAWAKRRMRGDLDNLRNEPGRVRTIAEMTKAVLKGLVWFIAILTVLGKLGVNTASIIATAGIGSLAIGFGAQSLVKDVITGFFILWENQFAVGDLIETANFTGYVEELGIRITKLKDMDGALHILPNGIITSVTNYSRGPIRAMIQVPIPYEEDIERVTRILEEGLANFRAEHSEVIEGPVVQGVSSLGESEVNIQIYSTVMPNQQWPVERKLRQVCKETMDAAGIDIPYPHLQVVRGD